MREWECSSILLISLTGKRVLKYMHCENSLNFIVCNGCFKRFGMYLCISVSSHVYVFAHAYVCSGLVMGKEAFLARKRILVDQHIPMCLHFSPHFHLFLKFSGHISFLLPGEKKEIQYAIEES